MLVLYIIASNFEIRKKSVLAFPFSSFQRSNREQWYQIHYESPYKERGACHHVGVRLPRNLSHLSVSYQRTFPLVSPLPTSYLTRTTLSTLHYTRGMHPRVSPRSLIAIVCIYQLASWAGRTSQLVTTELSYVRSSVFLPLV